MSRLFVGVPATEPLATDEVAAAVQATGEVRLVDPGLRHVTLLFLGEVSDSRIEAAKQALAAGCKQTSGGQGVVKGLGAFPDPRRARVVWLGIEGSPLDTLAASVRGAYSASQFRFDDKPFHAHLTLARAKRATVDVSKLVHEHAETTLGSFPCEAVHLYRSTLTPDGPVYETLASESLEA